MKALLILALCAHLLSRTDANAVEYQQVLIAGAKAIVCKVDLEKEKLQLFLRDDTGHPLNDFAALEKYVGPEKKLLFAMNAGMYHADYAPVGLHVEEGRQISPLNVAQGAGNFFMKPNGVFVISDKGAAVRETSEMLQFTDRIRLATQSGPLLVRVGQIHPAFKVGSENRLRRNGVGILSPTVVLFVITDEPVNLYDFARYFRDELHCQDALYFDGTVSSLFSAELHRSDKPIPLGPLIGIVGE